MGVTKIRIPSKGAFNVEPASLSLEKMIRSVLFIEQFIGQFIEHYEGTRQKSCEHYSNDAVGEPIYGAFKPSFQVNIKENWRED